MKLFNNPVFFLLVLGAFVFLAWISLHRMTPQQQMSALVERSIAEAEAHDRAQAEARAEEDFGPEADWNWLFNRCEASRKCANHFQPVRSRL